jgi:hypothetical protein
VKLYKHATNAMDKKKDDQVEQVDVDAEHIKAEEKKVPDLKS